MSINFVAAASKADLATWARKQVARGGVTLPADMPDDGALAMMIFALCADGKRDLARALAAKAASFSAL